MASENRLAKRREARGGESIKQALKSKNITLTGPNKKSQLHRLANS